MHSQLTLVNARGPPPSEENMILIFDRDDMTRTSLYICGNHLPSYFVNTLGDTTTIRSGNCLLATLRTENVDRIRLRFLA